MILPDVNLLVYAVDASSPNHERARQWWDETLSSSTTVGLCWPSLLGFIRLVTNRRVFASPLSIDEAMRYVGEWIEQPNAMIVVPGPRHWSILRRMLESTGVGANLTTDAHIAALAFEQGFTVASNDADFARFEGVRLTNPLAGRSARS